jgi:hypothetical protein
VAPGAKTVPSGIEISLTNSATSQEAVGGGATVDVGRARVGKLTAVFVAKGGGRVGVTKGVAWVDCVDMACTVKAAAVNTAFGSSVAGALDGRLQAARTKIIRNKPETMRMFLDILFS